MFKELKNYDYIAIIHYTDLINSFEEDPFDFKSMIFTKKFVIDSRYELNDLCNYLVKKCNIIPVAIDLYFGSVIDSQYRVEQKCNKLHLVRW